jgi:phosphatidylglycerophosphatase A
LKLLLAQGFGAGRIHPAPGTWGSVVGVAWFLLLLLLPSIAWFMAAVAGSVALAIPVCSTAERLLGQKDPGSVVIDEIVAMPVTLAWLVVGRLPADGSVSALGILQYRWPALLVGLVLFRLFDIWKPWPIRALQRLPGGWGVVADDLAAALAAGLLLALGDWGWAQLGSTSGLGR